MSKHINEAREAAEAASPDAKAITLGLCAVARAIFDQPGSDDVADALKTIAVEVGSLSIAVGER